MAFTKVVGAGIHTLSNITSHNINSSGIITATKFVGPMENSSGISTFYDLKVTNNLTVEGTTTTLDTKLVEVDKIEVEADSTNVAIAVTQTGSGDLIRLYDGASQVVTVDDEGNVGIRKDAPGTSLHVRSTATGGGNIAYFDDTGSGVTGRLMILTTDGVSGGGVKFQTVNKKYTYFGTSTNKLTIDNNNSRVGIMSDIPHRDLSINGSGADIALMGSNAGIYMGNSTGGFQNNCAIARAAAINFHISGSKPGDLCIAGESENDLIFGTSVSAGAMNERFRIGHAGISTFSENVHLTKGSGTALLKIENTNGTAHLDIRHTNGYGAVHYVHQGTEKWRVGQTAQADHFSIYQSTGAGGLPYRLFIQNNGEVGINTSDPEDTLHLLRDSVNHGIKLERGGTLPGTALVQVHSNGVLSLQGGNNIHYVSGGSQQHIWYRASTEIARFDTGGQLGIGTNAPGTKLDVRSGNWNNGDIVVGEPGSAGKIAFRRGLDGSNAAYIGYDGAENNNEVALAVNSGDGTILFKTNSQERVRINSTGKVGVGTDNPAYPLDIRHTGGNLNQTPIIRLFQSTDGCHNAITLESSTSADKNIGIQFKNQSTVKGGIGYIQNNKINIYTGTNASAEQGLTINASGFCGINETDPSTSLHVENNNANASTYYLNTDPAILVQNKNSNATAKTVLKLEGPVGGGDCALVYGAGGTNMIFADRQYERLRIGSTGKVGVGTNLSSSTYKFEVWDDTSATLMVRKGNSSRIVFSNDSQHNTLYSQALPGYTGRAFAVYIGSSEAVRISSTGNVGIATNLSGGGGAYGRLGVVIPSQSGGSALQVMNSAVGSGDGSLTNIVLRSVNNLGTQWAGAEYRAQEHIFSNQSSERLKIDSSGHLLPGNNASQDLGENSSSRWRNIYGGTLSLSSYATIGAIVVADPGSNYYSYNNRIGGGLAVVGNSYVFNGQVGINTNGHMNGRVTIKNTNGFNSASISSNTDNIYLISNTTSSDGAYGASIGFSRVQYSDRRAAAITTVQEGSDEDFVGLSFWTHDNADATAAIVEKLRITPKGTTFVSSGTRPKNQCEAAHSGDETLGLMVKRSICFSDSDTKGQGMVMVSHTKSVPCDGTTSDMITIRNREGCFIGDVYAGYSAGGSAAVCHKKFHTYYNGSTLTNENTPAGRISESLDITASYNNDVHTFRVTPDNTNNVYQGGSTLNVTMSIIALSAGAAGSDNFTVTYH